MARIGQAGVSRPHLAKQDGPIGVIDAAPKPAREAGPAASEPGQRPGAAGHTRSRARGALARPGSGPL
jgi:hypothetical protein